VLRVLVLAAEHFVDDMPRFATDVVDLHAMLAPTDGLRTRPAESRRPSFAFFVAAFFSLPSLDAARALAVSGLRGDFERTRATDDDEARLVLAAFTGPRLTDLALATFNLAGDFTEVARRFVGARLQARALDAGRFADVDLRRTVDLAAEREPARRAGEARFGVTLRVLLFDKHVDLADVLRDGAMTKDFAVITVCKHSMIFLTINIAIIETIFLTARCSV